MTFEDRLADAQSRVETELRRRLSPDDRVPPRLTEAVQHAVLGGGKRFRPFLVIESARLFDAPAEAAVTVAAALEAVHCYSLAHDDLPAMDNDLVRRGRPTVWKAYDEWTAILAGDALLTLAFEWLGDAYTQMSTGALANLVVDLAQAAGPAGMVGGQVWDLMSDKLGEPEVATLAHIRRLQEMKTGALIRFACRAGPILASRSQSDIDALTRYGEALGFAFQIADDLLDATGDATMVGKAIAKDAAAGKATLVSLHGIAGARQALAEAQAQARKALEPYGAAGEALLDAVAFVATRSS